MVAETQTQEAPKIATAADSFNPTAVAPRKRAKQRKRIGGRLNTSPNAWPLVRELAAQTLYLTDGLSPKQIAESLSTPKDRITPAAVSAFILRRGWTAKRREKQSESTSLVSTRTRAHIDRVVLAQSAVAEAASIAGLKRALDAADGSATFEQERDRANAFRAYAGGSRDMVNIMRQAHRLDEDAKRREGQTVNQLNIFSVGVVSSAVSAPAAVKPAVDVVASVVPAVVETP